MILGRELELKDTYSIPVLPTYTPKIPPPGPATGAATLSGRPVWNAGGYIVAVLTSLPPYARPAGPRPPICVGRLHARSKT